jgi:hypothetical protein
MWHKIKESSVFVCVSRLIVAFPRLVCVWEGWKWRVWTVSIILYEEWPSTRVFGTRSHRQSSHLASVPAERVRQLFTYRLVPCSVVGEFVKYMNVGTRLKTQFRCRLRCGFFPLQTSLVACSKVTVLNEWPVEHVNYILLLHGVLMLMSLLHSDPIAGLDKPLGFQEVEAPRSSRHSAHEGGKVSLIHRPPLPPRRYPWYSFLL